MIDDMGIFRTTVAVAHVARPDDRRSLHNVMVDTGSEYNWIPRAVLEELGVQPQRVDRFETADGRVLEREVAFAMLYAGGRSTASAVVFAERGDLVLLGAHGLEGLNLRVDLLRMELVPAGPVPAATLHFAA
jgi:predicted aspartyl protease